MDQVRNPYTPGPGSRPPHLAGRAAEIRDLDVALQRLKIGRTDRSPLLFGLRGVGKTALLRESARIAAKRGFVHEHVVVGADGAHGAHGAHDADGATGQLAPRLAVAFAKAVMKLGGKKKRKGVNRRALGVLKSFSQSLPHAAANTFADVDSVPGVADSGELAGDLGNLFEEMGRAAQAADGGIFLTLDEVHRLPTPTLEALVGALAHSRQAGVPVMVLAAALPTLPALRASAAEEFERTFRLRPLEPLSPDEAADALLIPAAAEGVGWKSGALSRVTELTGGYPYLLQEFAKQAWDLADEGAKMIRPGDVERSIPLALAELDEGFFGVRASKATPPERAYLRAMAELGPGVVRSADVAAVLRKKTTQVAPVRDTLMKKALCFSPRFNELAFTFPMFDQFMIRWSPALP